jgi:hypothetical protein
MRAVDAAATMAAHDTMVSGLAAAASAVRNARPGEASSPGVSSPLWIRPAETGVRAQSPAVRQRPPAQAPAAPG